MTKVTEGLQIARSLRPFLTSNPMTTPDADKTILDIARAIDNAIRPYKNIVDDLSKMGIHSPNNLYPVHKINVHVSRAIDVMAKANAREGTKPLAV